MSSTMSPSRDFFQIRFCARTIKSQLDQPITLRDEKGRTYLLEKWKNKLSFRPLKGEGQCLEMPLPRPGTDGVVLNWPGSKPLHVQALRLRTPGFLEKSVADAGKWVAYHVQGMRILEARSISSPEECPDSPDWKVVSVADVGVLDGKGSGWKKDDPFNRLSLKVLGGLALLLLLILFWPKSEEEKTEELVPAQYAKLILKPKKEAAAARPNPQTRVNTPAQLTKAVSSKSFQNSFSRLVQGGAFAKLNAFQGFQGLKGATIGPGSAGGLSKSMEHAMQSVGKGGNVATLGGSASGYAGAQSGGVSGQGNSFVSLDTDGASVEEGLTRDEVGRIIHQHMSEIRYCYESAMMNRPDLRGKITLDFTIQGEGLVKSARSKDSDIPDPAVEKCVLKRLVTWKFPKPRGKVNVAVTYPFFFQSVRR